MPKELMLLLLLLQAPLLIGALMWQVREEGKCGQKTTKKALQKGVLIGQVQAWLYVLLLSLLLFAFSKAAILTSVSFSS